MQSQWINKRSPTFIWLLVTGFTLLAGGLIELGQAGTSRSADLLDMVRNCLGGWFVLAYYPLTSSTLSHLFRQAIRLLLLLMFLVMSYEIPLRLYDSYKRYHDFPVLADFESLDHINRFEGDSDFTWDPQGYLDVSFRKGQLYSSIRMRKFPEDWSDYQHLSISLTNPSDKPLRISVKIHDWGHLPNFYYNDRFNRSFDLSPGETLIEISLNEIRNAPKKRKIDLSTMHTISLFVIRPKFSQRLKIKRIELR